MAALLKLADGMRVRVSTISLGQGQGPKVLLRVRPAPHQSEMDELTSDIAFVEQENSSSLILWAVGSCNLSTYLRYPPVPSVLLNWVSVPCRRRS
jgi:hypothetical protein